MITDSQIYQTDFSMWLEATNYGFSKHNGHAMHLLRYDHDA